MTEEIKLKRHLLLRKRKKGKPRVARVRLYKGTGRVIVNKKDPKEYFWNCRHD